MEFSVDFLLYETRETDCENGICADFLLCANALRSK